MKYCSGPLRTKPTPQPYSHGWGGDIQLSVAAGLFGGLAVVGGFLVRAGIWRGRWVELYRNRKLPALTRNGVLALLPFGLAFVFFSPGMQCGGSHFHEIPWCSSPLAGAGLLAGLVFVALG